MKGLAAIFSLLAGMTASLPANAAYFIEVREVGSDIVATGGGSFDLTELEYVNTATFPFGALRANPAHLAIGSLGGGDLNVYFGITGPTNMGPGVDPDNPEDYYTLDGLEGPKIVYGPGQVFGLPAGYVSGTELGTSTAIWRNRSFASRGLTPGTYVWTWGAGTANQDIFAVQVGPAIPESSTWAMMLLGFGFVGAAMRKSRQTAGVRHSMARTVTRRLF